MLRSISGGQVRHGRGVLFYPSLVLDFTNGLNDPRITYSGGANGTRVNSAGLIVAASCPRIDYDPVTLAAKGLLVEEARTNLLTYSAEFDNAAWGKSSAAVAVTANATTSPDGTVSADKIYEADTTNTSRNVIQAASTIASSATCTGSVYVKQAERTSCQVRITNGNGTSSVVFANINLSNGTITGSGPAAGMVSGSASIVSARNGWYRVVLTGVFPADVTLAGVDLYCYNGTTTNYAGVVNSGFYVWGAQLEAGSFPTSYIPTTSASVTRSADSAVMTGTNFSDWYNANTSTFLAEYDIPNAVTGSAVSRVFAASDVSGETVNGQFAFVSGPVGKICSSNSFSASANAGRLDAAETYTPGAVVKVACAYALNDRAMSVNAATPITSTSGALPVDVDRLQIGAGLGGANSLNGHVRSIRFWPQRLPNATLQGMTV
jgi:hypothetical protein